MEDTLTAPTQANQQPQPAKLPAPPNWSRIFANPTANLGVDLSVKLTLTQNSPNRYAHEGHVALSTDFGFNHVDVILAPAQCRELAQELIRIAELADADNLAARGL